MSGTLKAPHIPAPRPEQAICRACRHGQSLSHSHATCQSCGRRSWLQHPDLSKLHIAHIDCDAFYAAVEKRERPDWADKPLIVGGRQRGVVTTACYIARMYGVKSAMPMFTARAKCPDAIIVKPRMGLYRDVGLQIRDAMRRLSPLIQPVSIDEAYVDLSPSQQLHGKAPYEVLLDFQDWVAANLGLTISIGLAHNKLLAKIASDLEKPSGFSILGPSDAQDFLADKSVRILWGIGPAFATSLARRGIHTVGDLRRFSPAQLTDWFGSMGPRLAAYGRGEDSRRVRNTRTSKSISAETTFGSDLGALEDLAPHIERLAGRVSARAVRADLKGWVLTLKLKTEDFQTFTRRQKMNHPTQDEADMIALAKTLLRAELSRGPFRLLGLGISELVAGTTQALAPQAGLLN